LNIKENFGLRFASIERLSFGREPPSARVGAAPISTLTGAMTMTTRKLDTRKAAFLTLALLGAIPLVGCEEKGPAEKAGAKVDQAGKDLGDAINPKGPGEKAGEKLDKALGK
jgi:hypothetical protein